MVSRKLVEAVKLNRRKGYEIAQAANIHPSTLSKILNGIERVRPGDRRVLALGQVLGMKDTELFESSQP
jgi:transcriptional regulator with XRE-family HTH domain